MAGAYPNRLLAVRALTSGLIALGLVELLLIAALVNRYPAVLTSPPDGWQYPLRPAALIVVYVVAGVGVLRTRLGEGLADATKFGLVAGAIEVMSIVLESFLQVPQGVTTAYTGLLILSGFAIWGLSSYWATRTYGSWPIGVLSSVWTGLLGILIGIAVACVITNLFLPQMSVNLINDPDYLRSSWRDLSGFTVINTLDNAFSHLAMAPFVAVVMGLLGAAVAQVRRHRWPQPGGRSGS